MNNQQGVLNEVIGEHLYREGYIETARKFEEETGVELENEIKEPLKQLHTIIRAMHQRDLQPAIQYLDSIGSISVSRIPNFDHRWAEQHKVTDKPAHLLFDLRAMEYLYLLKQHKIQDALNYARTHFSAHAQTHMTGAVFL